MVKKKAPYAAKNTQTYQALYTESCLNREAANKFAKQNEEIKDMGFCTRIYHALLAKYGGEPFSLEDAGEVFQNTRGTASFEPGSTPEKVLETLVEWELVRKVQRH